jgi:hypothetical protein
MKIVVAFIVSFWVLVCGEASVVADTLEAQSAALKEIRATANDMCSDVNSNVTVSQLNLSGSGKAKLDGLIGKVVDLGIDGAVDLKRGEFNGPLQEQLAKALHDKDLCKQHIFDILQEKMLGKRGENETVPLNRAHFDVISSFPPGSLVLAIANPTSEEMSVYSAMFEFPAQSLQSFGGAPFDKNTVKSFAVQLQFATGDPARIRAGVLERVQSFAYGCSANGLASWTMMHTVYASPKVGPIGNCRACLKASTVSQSETELCQEFDCGKLIVLSNPPAPC